MAVTNQASFPKVAMLSLALSISTACAQIAAAAPQVVEIVKPGKVQEKRELEQKAKLRASIKHAMASLGKLHRTMELSCQLLSSDEALPRQALDEQPFSEIVLGLRSLEESTPIDSPLHELPVIGDEFSALRRQLARTRSLAARAELLAKQRMNIPEVFDSSVDVQGLRALADMTADRFNRLVG